MKTMTKGITAAGVTALAGLGAYLMSSKMRRNHIRGWMLRLKADVLDEAEDMKDMTQEKFNEVVDRVSKRYERSYSVPAKELSRLTGDIKSAWQDFQKHELKA